MNNTLIKSILLLIILFLTTYSNTQFTEAFFNKGSIWDNVDNALAKLGMKKDELGQMYTKETHPKYYKKAYENITEAQKYLNEFKKLTYSEVEIVDQSKLFSDKYDLFYLAVKYYIYVLDSGIEDLAAIAVIDLAALLNDYIENYSLLKYYGNDKEKFYSKIKRLSLMEKCYQKIGYLLEYYLMYYSNKEYFNEEIKCEYMKNVYLSAKNIKSRIDIFGGDQKPGKIEMDKYLEGKIKAKKYQINNECTWLKKIDNEINKY